jgi:hypothetical protein
MSPGKYTTGTLEGCEHLVLVRGVRAQAALAYEVLIRGFEGGGSRRGNPGHLAVENDR